MKKSFIFFLTLILCLSPFSGCDNTTENTEGIHIDLSDTEILIDGISATNDENLPVYVANDIVYYEEGHDFTYGEGEKDDAHSKEEAEKHIVVHITKPGNYILSGKLSSGQIAIDLGKDSKEDPQAIVNLYLNGVDITSTVAPAVIFYNVYEPFGDVTEENATKDVDTKGAGANVFIVDGTENNIHGSYVARIYKPDSVVLSEDGKYVKEAKKLHKYDGAFYSRVTMNIYGKDGILNIKAENEGLDSEMHLTINGGIVNIESANDGINTNEDYVSVTTINGGELNILVNGKTGEGDGIDSNGWLVINGGKVTSQACSFSMDGGIDSDMGIHINGGTVIASGNMLDRISESENNYAVLNFSKFLGAGKYTLKNSENVAVLEKEISNSFTSLIVSCEELVQGDYTLWYEDTQLAGFATENGGGMGGGMFGGMGGNRPDSPKGERPESFNSPEGFESGKRPDMSRDFAPAKNLPDMPDMTKDFAPGKNRPDMTDMPDMPEMEGKDFPEDFENKGFKDKGFGGFGANMPNQAVELSEIFTIKKGANYFSFISIKE